jgi:hypothetical protein
VFQPFAAPPKALRRAAVAWGLHAAVTRAPLVTTREDSFVFAKNDCPAKSETGTTPLLGADHVGVVCAIDLERFKVEPHPTR